MRDSRSRVRTDSLTLILLWNIFKQSPTVHHYNGTYALTKVQSHWLAAVAVVELLRDTKGRECETEEGACCSGKYGYDHQNFIYVQFVSKMSTFLTEGN